MSEAARGLMNCLAHVCDFLRRVSERDGVHVSFAMVIVVLCSVDGIEGQR